MGEITTIGLDLAKHVFQVHGVNGKGITVLRKRLPRGQMLSFLSPLAPCLIGVKACTTAHYWAQELRALGHPDACAIREVSNLDASMKAICFGGFSSSTKGKLARTPSPS